jgi:hypothetical protein
MPAEENSPPVKQPEVVDPFNAPPLFVDWIVTGGVQNNVLNLTLGTIDHSMKGPDDELPRIMIGTRLRCSRDFAIRFHAFLGEVLGLTPPPSGEAGAASPPRPPNTTIN